ncbi:ion transporter, partial [Mycobacterium numidiamassiliense]
VSARPAVVLFEHLVTAAIVANFVVLVASCVDKPREGLYEVAHLALLGFFCLELGMRLHRLGWSLRRIARDRWLVFDGVIVAVALLPLTGDLAFMRAARTARMLHTLRHVADLRLVPLAVAR